MFSQLQTLHASKNDGKTMVHTVPDKVIQIQGKDLQTIFFLIIIQHVGKSSLFDTCIFHTLILILLSYCFQNRIHFKGSCR